MPGLCFSHPHNHRSLLKTPPVDDKWLNAELPRTEEAPWLKIQTSEMEQNVFLKFIVEKQNPAVPFSNHRNTFN